MARIGKGDTSPQEFLDKCAWEGGGIIEGLIYGLTADDLDDSDPVFKSLVRVVEERYKAMEPYVHLFNDYCEENELESDV
jgi:hypothetical protein